MNHLIAQVWGTVNPPPGVSSYSGIQAFISAMIKTVIAISAIYALFNLIFAGYSFMSAGANPDKIAQSWAKIWQTLLGLLVAVGAFVLAGIFGKLIFGDYNALLQLRIFGPT